MNVSWKTFQTLPLFCSLLRGIQMKWTNIQIKWDSLINFNFCASGDTTGDIVFLLKLETVADNCWIYALRIYIIQIGLHSKFAILLKSYNSWNSDSILTVLHQTCKDMKLFDECDESGAITYEVKIQNSFTFLSQSFYSDSIQIFRMRVHCYPIQVNFPFRFTTLKLKYCEQCEKTYHRIFCSIDVINAFIVFSDVHVIVLKLYMKL